MGLVPHKKCHVQDDLSPSATRGHGKKAQKASA